MVVWEEAIEVRGQESEISREARAECKSGWRKVNPRSSATLAKTLKRPAFFHAPAFALRLLMRDVATEMFLSSQRVRPSVALDLGFTFSHPDLQSALAASLNPAS